VRRLGEITKKCSEKLYANETIPFEDLEIISVVIEEFVDRFHHGKEEQAYFPETKDKDNFSEDIRKFLIEHELGRRIAKMFLRNLKTWKDGGKKGSIEPLARFLKSYSVFITDHTGKEDIFFNLIEDKSSISSEEDEMLMKHFQNCRNQVGGIARIEQMRKLIEYLEHREWMK
jgi:hemerythrin-like domain-containing protein